jgi:DNA-binding PadR family transcriptional regulator
VHNGLYALLCIYCLAKTWEFRLSLRYAILAALNEGDATGYDLVKEFDGSIGFFWPATHQQIYRELDSLHKAKAVTFEIKEGKRGAERKVFTLTKKGREELREWIEKECKRTPPKSELLVKIFAGEIVSNQVLRKHFEKAREETAARLKAYRAIEKRYFSNPSRLPRKKRLQYLTLRCGIMDAEAYLKWVHEAFQLLE